ncbi:peroxidase, partial [Pyxidicoccus fallax]
PTRIPGADDGPPTYLNRGSHWWDASQIYGNSEAEIRELRCSEDDGKDSRGKLKLVGQDQAERLPVDARTRMQKSGVTQNWWMGLSLMHTLFTKEHNAIVDRLRLEYPDWSGDQLFETARLINTALMAKIHTVEWTPAILGHPTLRSAMNAHWWGLVTERVTRVFGRLSRLEAIGGIPGASTKHFGVPYALTEEFVSVYRLHSLIPDTVRLYRVEDGKPVREVGMADITGEKVQAVFEGGLSIDDVCYSFGISHPGAIVLHNYPHFLRTLEAQDPHGLPGQKLKIDLAAIDIMRDRERGVPRYNDFRELMYLPRCRSFKDITRNAEWARQLKDVYGDVDRVDLQVGMLAEAPPRGFGFSDTAFRIFVLMASRRLTSDRFFTTDFNVNLYTRPGMDWINNNTMTSVLLRHYPGLKPSLVQVTNAFTPWASMAH